MPLYIPLDRTGNTEHLADKYVTFDDLRKYTLYYSGASYINEVAIDDTTSVKGGANEIVVSGSPAMASQIPYFKQNRPWKTGKSRLGSRWADTTEFCPYIRPSLIEIHTEGITYIKNGTEYGATTFFNDVRVGTIQFNFRWYDSAGTEVLRVTAYNYPGGDTGRCRFEYWVYSGNTSLTNDEYYTYPLGEAIDIDNILSGRTVDAVAIKYELYIDEGQLPSGCSALTANPSVKAFLYHGDPALHTDVLEYVFSDADIGNICPWYRLFSLANGTSYMVDATNVIAGRNKDAMATVGTITRHASNYDIFNGIIVNAAGITISDGSVVTTTATIHVPYEIEYGDVFHETGSYINIELMDAHGENIDSVAIPVASGETLYNGYVDFTFDAEDYGTAVTLKCVVEHYAHGGGSITNASGVSYYDSDMVCGISMSGNTAAPSKAYYPGGNPLSASTIDTPTFDGYWEPKQSSIYGEYVYMPSSDGNNVLYNSTLSALTQTAVSAGATINVPIKITWRTWHSYGITLSSFEINSSINSDYVWNSYFDFDSAN